MVDPLSFKINGYYIFCDNLKKNENAHSEFSEFDIFKKKNLSTSFVGNASKKIWITSVFFLSNPHQFDKHF